MTQGVTGIEKFEENLRKTESNKETHIFLLQKLGITLEKEIKLAEERLKIVKKVLKELPTS